MFFSRGSNLVTSACSFWPTKSVRSGTWKISTCPAGMNARMPFTSSSSPPLFVPVTVPSTICPTSRLSHDTFVAVPPLRARISSPSASSYRWTMKSYSSPALGSASNCSMEQMPWLLPPKSTKASSLFTAVTRPPADLLAAADGHGRRARDGVGPVGRVQLVHVHPGQGRVDRLVKVGVLGPELFLHLVAERVLGHLR